MRVEDQGMLTGKTAYVRDLAADDCDHVVFVRSTVAHGTIRSIDTSGALDAPGARAVLTAADLSTAPFRFYDPIPEEMARPLLASDRVRMVGEPVAVVVADSPARAVDAAELVEVGIDPLDAVTTPAAAAAPDAPQLFDAAGSNTVIHYDRGRIADLFDLAAHVEAGRFPNQRLSSAPMEPTGVIARPTGDGGLDVLCTSQGVHVVRNELAEALDLDAASIRVRTPAVGGGFGGRHSAPIELILVAAAALALDRPLRWDETRSENLATMVHGRAQDHEVEMGFDDDGLIVGLRVRNIADCGAYPHFGPLMPFMSRRLALRPLPRASRRLRVARGGHDDQPDRAVSGCRPARGDERDRAHDRERCP